MTTNKIAGSFLAFLMGLLLLFIGTVGLIGGFLRPSGWEFVIGAICVYGGCVLLKAWKFEQG